MKPLLSACQHTPQPQSTHAHTQLSHHLHFIQSYLTNLMRHNPGPSSLFTICTPCYFAPVMLCALYKTTLANLELAEDWLKTFLCSIFIYFMHLLSDIIHRLWSKFLHCVANSQEYLIFANKVCEFCCTELLDHHRPRICKNKL